MLGVYVTCRPKLWTYDCVRRNKSDGSFTNDPANYTRIPSVCVSITTVSNVLVHLGT